MNNHALKQLEFDLLLKIESGADSGTIYQITGANLRIGRAEDNDIVLNDLKTSRYHATIEFNYEGVLVKNVSTNQDIKVDGISTNEAYLQIGQRLTIGSTEIVLLQKNDLSELNKNKNNLDIVKTKKATNPLFYVYAVLAVGFLYLLLSASPKTNQITDLRDQTSIQKEINEAKKIAEALENAKYTSGKDTKQYIDAQESYLKGFRDYREENYTRAITNFQATLALYPKHPLAKHYLSLSNRKLDEQIQYFMQEGNRFMEHGRYTMALSAFKNVMILIKDSNNPNYKEAMAKYRQSKAVIEEAF